MKVSLLGEGEGQLDPVSLPHAPLEAAPHGGGGPAPADPGPGLGVVPPRVRKGGQPVPVMSRSIRTFQNISNFNYLNIVRT